jgi:hypothetical protein
MFRDVLSLVSGKARRGGGTPVDEEQRRMKPKSKRRCPIMNRHGMLVCNHAVRQDLPEG